VESDAYWLAVVRYIDRNPVAARIVDRAVDYPYGSAFHYSRRKGPRWLRRDMVEALVLEEKAAGSVFDPRRYGDWTSAMGSEGAAWVVESQLGRKGRDTGDPLADLVGASPSKVRAWMESKAMLADGMAPGRVLLSPATVRDSIGRSGGAGPASAAEDPRARKLRREAMEAGMLRAFSGLSQEEVASRMGIPRGTARERLKTYRDLIRSDPAFPGEVAGLLAMAIRVDHGDSNRRRIPFVLPAGDARGEGEAEISPNAAV
jgi:hypothetical protein